MGATKDSARTNKGTFKPGNPHRFTPGVGNPFRLPKDLLGVNLLTKSYVDRVISKYLQTTLEDLNKLIQPDKVEELKALDALIINIIWKAMKDGDIYKLESLLTRVLGRPKEAEPEKIKDDDLKNKLAALPEETALNFLDEVKNAAKKREEQSSV